MSEPGDKPEGMGRRPTEQSHGGTKPGTLGNGTRRDRHAAVSSSLAA